VKPRRPYAPAILVETVETFLGMERGHPVKVKDLRGSYVFISARVHGDEVESVCVFGGSANRAAFRHVLPERIIKRRLASR